MNKHHLMTTKEAETKICPFKFHEVNKYAQQCLGSNCMAWVNQQNKIKREDHSGGSARMAELAMNRGARVRREGASGCMGMLVIDARGYCSRIHQSYEKDKEGY